MRAEEYLKSIDYPGRIIAAGTDLDGRDAFAYAITARSESSQNRVLEEDGNNVFTRVYKTDVEMIAPELLVYQAVMTSPCFTLIGNGDHTTYIAAALEEGKTLSEAFSDVCYEPDSPAFTPRIAVLLKADEIAFMIARKEGGECLRKIYVYPNEKGVMHIIHTYASNGSPLPSFSSMPVRVEAASGKEIWSALSPAYRVAMFYKHGSYKQLINVNGGGCGEA
ncbi:MAG: hypothetical protein IAA97_02590 [Spirochaetes bacterium]|uniref:Inosine monophosphate cyclohydrolase-like domain-containing protein n=1 Tax=Candidatus Ornithospirochaeta stercoripullorum TaxID=2840899 RepID=A0A9D9E2E9_9SPIO|nr:hypothetical protein [Candidatus Ornithospirochaeta stercoripullorum]